MISLAPLFIAIVVNTTSHTISGLDIDHVEICGYLMDTIFRAVADHGWQWSANGSAGCTLI